MMNIILTDRVGPRLSGMDCRVQTVFPGPPSALFDNQHRHDALHHRSLYSGRWRACGKDQLQGL